LTPPIRPARGYACRATVLALCARACSLAPKQRIRAHRGTNLPAAKVPAAGTLFTNKPMAAM
jgi:hypothetical protein